MKQNKQNLYEDFKMDYDTFKKKLQEKIDLLYGFLKENLGDEADGCLTNLDGAMETILNTASKLLENTEN